MDWWAPAKRASHGHTTGSPLGVAATAWVTRAVRLADTDPPRRATSACREGREEDAGRFAKSEGHRGEKGREARKREKENNAFTPLREKD